jgi:hypothetical protein
MDLDPEPAVVPVRPLPGSGAQKGDTSSRTRCWRGTLLVRAAERGDNLGAITAALLRLLDRYGAAELEAAIGEALDRGVPHPNAVRLALDHRREQRHEPPPVAVDLPAHVKTRDAPVQAHRLEAYDQLKDQSLKDQTNE